MAASFARKVLTREAVVVGAGVSGLTTALRLAEAGFKVRVAARERSPATTSDIAAAVWYPFRCGPPERSLGWSRRAFRVFKELARDPDTGVTMVEGIDLIAHRDGPPWWSDAVDVVRPAEPAELPHGYTAGHVFTAPVAQMPVFLAWLERKLVDAGVTIETRTVTDLPGLLLEASLVVNCTGLAARELVRDDDLHPIRGQIVRVEPGHAPRFVQGGGAPNPLLYVIPRPDCTVLGGTEQIGSWDLDIDPGTADAIVARCRAVVPTLNEAAILSHAVGLRPGRSEVRLESGRLPGGLLIHNYGHGGGGMTLSWGCAEEVVRRAAAEIPPAPD
jgi:D-amino-acid oxidase